MTKDSKDSYSDLFYLFSVILIFILSAFTGIYALLLLIVFGIILFLVKHHENKELEVSRERKRRFPLRPETTLFLIEQTEKGLKYLKIMREKSPPDKKHIYDNLIAETERKIAEVRSYIYIK